MARARGVRPGCGEPAPWSDGFAFMSNFRSSGLVQGTASLDSTTLMVFDMPAVIDWIGVTRPAWNIAPSPTKTR